MSRNTDIETQFGVWFRLGLYFTIACLTAMITEFSAIRDNLDTLVWVDWWIITAKICLPGIIAVRAYFDQSIARLPVKVTSTS